MRSSFLGGDVHWGKGCCAVPLTGAGNTSPSSGLPSSTTLLCLTSRATEVEAFNFGICDGNLEGSVSVLEAE